MNTLKRILIMLIIPALGTARSMTFDPDKLCTCSGKYVRFEFEVNEGRFSNFSLVNGSGDESCDIYLTQIVEVLQRRPGFPNGVTGVGIFGFENTLEGKTREPERCRFIENRTSNTKIFWYVENVSFHKLIKNGLP